MRARIHYRICVIFLRPIRPCCQFISYGTMGRDQEPENRCRRSQIWSQPPQGENGEEHHSAKVGGIGRSECQDNSEDRGWEYHDPDKHSRETAEGSWMPLGQVVLRGREITVTLFGLICRQVRMRGGMAYLRRNMRAPGTTIPFDAPNMEKTGNTI